MTDKELKEKLLENLLEAAAADYLEEQAKLLVPDAELEEPHQFSPAFEGEMERLLRQHKRQSRRGWQRPIVKAAAAFLVCVTTATLVMTNVEAVRVPVLNLLINAKEKFTTVYIEDGDESNVVLYEIPASIEERLPGYIPEGFAIVDCIDLDDGDFSVRYENQAKEYIIFGINYNIDFMSFDTEDAEVVELEILGRKTLVSISEKKDRIIMSMLDGNTLYDVTGNIDLKMGIKIMQSVKL